MTQDGKKSMLIAAGVFVVLVVLLDVFEAIVFPRRVTHRFRLARVYYQVTWSAWGVLARLVPAARRQTWMSVFGPLSILTLLASWAAALIVGFALIHHSIDPRPGGLRDALYFSGTTFTTLGYGDMTPHTPAARAVSVLEAATGFGFFAVVISYLPVLYQAFSRREAFIALLDARAGSPPAAARLLLRLPAMEDGIVCLNDFLAEAERWSAELLEAHLSFPILGYYRSQHDNQSWLAALACALDASALLLTIVDGRGQAQPRLTFAMARHAAVDLGLVLNRPPVAPDSDRLPPSRLEELVASLRNAGVKVHDDASARAKLTELRGLYEPFIAGLALQFRLSVPEIWPADERPDNWRTSAWARRAGTLASLSADPNDEHFD